MFTAEVESILKMRERFKEAVLGKYGTVTKPHLVAISKSIRASSMKVVFWLTISGVIVAANFDSATKCLDDSDKAKLIARCKNRHNKSPRTDKTCRHKVKMLFKGTPEEAANGDMKQRTNINNYEVIEEASLPHGYIDDVGRNEISKRGDEVHSCNWTVDGCMQEIMRSVSNSLAYSNEPNPVELA